MTLNHHAEYSLFDRALLQKRPVILRSRFRVKTLNHHMDIVWLRFVGSLKFQVSFADYRLFYRALLHKRPVILRSLPIVVTPYRES